MHEIVQKVAFSGRDLCGEPYQNPVRLLTLGHLIRPGTEGNKTQTKISGDLREHQCCLLGGLGIARIAETQSCKSSWKASKTTRTIHSGYMPKQTYFFRWQPGAELCC